MVEKVNLVMELAVILIAAGFFTILSKALKQPLILGYIIAGFIVGPHLGLFPKLTSVESVEQWSEIGIIFLLFGLGLEFSFKKLIKIGSKAIITAGTKCVGMFIVGLVAGKLMSWTMMESIFLGGLLSMSSTTIIIKAYDDMGLKNRPYSSLLFGSLVVEDLIAVLLLVLLSTLALSNKLDGGVMLLGIAKMVFFIILWFLCGIYLIPTILRKAKKYLSDEILLIFSIGLCFGMVALAELAGFSSALGAFVMGSILSDTVEGERIEHLILNIKNLFGAIFFVSVGMMVDPAVIAHHWAPILVITLVAMAGILVFSSVGALVSGAGLNHSLHVGFSLAQLGEFAFIIASLGCSLGVMRDFIYPVIIAVSVITTFTTPYMIKLADPASLWIEQHLPASLVARLTPSQDMKEGSRAVDENEWKALLKSLGLRIFIYSVLLVALLIGSDKLLHPFIQTMFSSWTPLAVDAVTTGITLLAMIPFLFALAIPSGGMAKPAQELLKNNMANSWYLMLITVLRFALTLIFVIVLVTSYFEMKFLTFILILIFCMVGYFLCRRILHSHSRLEETFFRNLNEKEDLRRKNAPVTTSVQDSLGNYDVQLKEFVLPADSKFAGMKLRELPFRESHDVNIVAIKRGSRTIMIPGGEERIYPSDTLLTVGTSAQLESFLKSMAEEEPVSKQEASDEKFIVKTVVLSEDSYLVGTTLRSTRMRNYGCMVISVLRGDSFLTNPHPDYKFQAGDTVWLAGTPTACAMFIR